jgi:hypothetical protein
MLLMYSRPPGHSILPIKLISVVDGAPLRNVRVRLLSNDKVDFLELCNDRLLIKQKHHALQVLNVFDGHVKSVSTSIFKSPEVLFPRCTSTIPKLSPLFLFPGFYFPSKFKVVTEAPAFYRCCRFACQHSSTPRPPPPLPFHATPSCLLTLDCQRLCVWDSSGARITTFDDHCLAPKAQVSCAFAKLFATFTAHYSSCTFLVLHCSTPFKVNL